MGKFGSYIVFELALKYRVSELQATDTESDGNIISKMRKKVLDEEAVDSIAVNGNNLPQNLDVRRKDTKSMMMMHSKSQLDEPGVEIEESGLTNETGTSKVVGLYESEVLG